MDGWIKSQVSACYLDPGLSQLGPLRELLPGVDVGVVGSFKSLLQLLQLLRRECGPTPPLLPLQGEVRLRLHVRHLIHATAWTKTRRGALMSASFILRKCNNVTNTTLRCTVYVFQIGPIVGRRWCDTFSERIW